MASATLAQLVPAATLRRLVQDWLREDIPSFDYGGAVVGQKQESARLLAKAPGILAGAPIVDAVFAELGCQVSWLLHDGDTLPVSEASPKAHVATVSGPAAALLQGERTALNVLCRASGSATLARQLTDAAKACGWAGRVAATRKTTPGFRLVEKYASLIGGADTHRMDLSSMIMLKDNHIWSAGSITAAVEAARRIGGFALKIEVECQNKDEAEEAIAAGADIVMLDNHSPALLHASAAALKAAHPHVLIEASGGITPQTMPEYFHPCVDVISTSRFTQGCGVVDFSLKVVH